MAEVGGARKAPAAAGIAVMIWGLTMALPTGAQAQEAAGRFLVEYGTVETADYGQYETVLRDEHVLENVAASLNRTLRLPGDVTLRVEECGDSAATWNRAARRVSLCYELLQAVLELSLAVAGDDEDRADRWFSGMTTFIVFHQLGHALGDVLDLPDLPTPETAADQFAMVALGGAVAQPQEILGALEFLDYAVGNENAAGLGFIEAHAYDRARVDRLACGFAGALPAALPWLEQLKLLPAAGAVRCGEEFASIDRQWDERLAPWLRAPPRMRQSSVAGLERRRLTP